MAGIEDRRAELEALEARVSELARGASSEDDKNLLAEKLSEAKAAYRLVRDRGLGTLPEDGQRYDPSWKELASTLADLRRTIESRPVALPGDGERRPPGVD